MVNNEDGNHVLECYVIFLTWVVSLYVEISYVQVDKHDIIIYTTYISVDLVDHKTFHAKVGKGGINVSLFA